MKKFIFSVVFVTCCAMEHESGQKNILSNTQQNESIEAKVKEIEKVLFAAVEETTIKENANSRSQKEKRRPCKITWDTLE